MQKIKKDIFISCRYDGSGNQFANRLSQDLEAMGYSVYYDANESYAHSFPEHIREAVISCKDFILILSVGCLERLIRNDPIDWVRDEILTAKEYDKPIIPILMDNVSFPADSEIMPENLQFLPHIPAIRFPEKYIQSPFSILVGRLNAGQDGAETYKNVFNSNPHYRVHEDYAKILQAAQDGDVKAMYEMGMMGFYGVTNDDGTQSTCDYEQADYWLRRVVDSDDELKYHALNILARMYYMGLIPREPQSYKKSFEYHSTAAEQNYASASYMGFLLREGVGCSFDVDTALEYHKTHLQDADTLVHLALAKFLAKYGHYQEAFEIYNSMENLPPEATYQLGLLYLDGVLSDPPKPDYYMAAYHFRDAADKGHIQAAYQYGLLCFRPSGSFRKDFHNAQKYLKIAADGGFYDAQYILGYMYHYGHVKKDLRLAVNYLEKAKNQGQAVAALDLATLYQQPECQNYQRAYECAKLAAAQDSPEGELILGNLLFWGRGCEPDMNKAYEMYSRAYQHGLYYASVMMEKIDKIRDINGYN